MQFLEKSMYKLVAEFAFLVTALFALPVTSAQAQNARSWVSSIGSDSNNCSRLSPCTTFSHALSQTNAGGEINCADQGDFGGTQLLITKSITIDCEGGQGRFGYAVVGSVAIDVNASSTDVVVLRGLDIDGNGISSIGIEFARGADLHVEKCVIHDFASNNFGWGIMADPFANSISQLFVSDTVLENNGTAVSGGGIFVGPNQSGGITRATLSHVEARNNFFGIKADGTFGSGGGVINMTVGDSVSSGNHSNGIVGTGNANGPSIIMMVEDSTSSQNATAGFGIIADGPRTTIALTNSTVMGNINGIGASNGGQLVSYQDNKIDLNSTDGSPTSVISAK
jgi:hypothetical protein